ncbi:AfsR/SARP family transcriptional regulator [Streptomyces sp. NPDC087263]|uniref:AfsR/SARP family transcriptional regulator n=1 Tax=Streptomyces sp. NPDC087263 TaxID=3365773 RepID=UPI003817CAC1
MNQFTRLSRRGNTALILDDDYLASRLLGEALQLWNGTALSDVQIGPLLKVHKTRLEEMRLSTHEQRIEADLRGGLRHELLAELAGLPAQYPLSEHLHAQFMIAPFRSGRRGRAVETFLRLRKTLDEELGLGPSVRARAFFQEAIADDEIAGQRASHTMPSPFRSQLHQHVAR